jgi:hypothetical protein
MGEGARERVYERSLTLKWGVNPSNQREPDSLTPLQGDKALDLFVPWILRVNGGSLENPDGGRYVIWPQLIAS